MRHMLHSAGLGSALSADCLTDLPPAAGLNSLTDGFFQCLGQQENPLRVSAG